MVQITIECLSGIALNRDIFVRELVEIMGAVAGFDYGGYSDYDFVEIIWLETDMKSVIGK